MLKINGVSLRRGGRLLFENATFQVHRGQRLGLVGANGSGKSSLLALIRGVLDADAGDVTRHPRELLAHVDQETPAVPRPALAYVMDGDQRLRSLEAAIATAEGTGATGRLSALYEEMEAIGGFVAEQRAARLLHGLGFAAATVSRPVGSFSGGWRMRLNLARALMCRSDIVLLDEPTNHLDLPAILWLEQWLKAYSGIALLISHDRDFMDALCTHIAHIENRAIRLYPGNYSQFERLRGAQLAQAQAAFEKQRRERRHVQSFVDRFRYKASKARQAQSRLKWLERMADSAPAHVDSPFDFRFPAPARLPPQLLKLEHAAVGWREPVLTDVKFSLVPGDRFGLLGANGAGKSTLVKALADGSTLLAGERSADRDCRIGYFAQHQLEQLQADRSPLQHLAAIAPDAGEQDLRDYLGGFDFRGDRTFEPVAPFSGGEKARLALALLIYRRPNLLLLDEPTNHLDLEMRRALGLALQDFDGALVVISHDRYLLHSVCDELYLVHGGRLTRFEQELDAYPAWLRSQQRSGGAAPAGKGTGPRQRKTQRQRQADQREQLKTLRARLRRVERELEAHRAEQVTLQHGLGNPALYTDPQHKAERIDLVKREAGLAARIDALENEWLEAGEALERSEAI